MNYFARLRYPVYITGKLAKSTFDKSLNFQLARILPSLFHALRIPTVIVIYGVLFFFFFFTHLLQQRV